MFATFLYEEREANLSTADDQLILSYTYCRPPAQVPARGTVVLLHGFPGTTYQFRYVLPLFALAGYIAVAPSYRGTGQSSRSDDEERYTKASLASDLQRLITRLSTPRSPLHTCRSSSPSTSDSSSNLASPSTHTPVPNSKHNHSLGLNDSEITTPIHLVGHDFGAYIAIFFALLCPSLLSSLVFGEAIIPGTGAYEKTRSPPALQHFSFHPTPPPFASTLVRGNERMYLKHFFDRSTINKAAISDEDLDFYTEAYSRPGTLKAAINLYRAFGRDADDLKSILTEHGKCKVKALALYGAESPVRDAASSTAQELFEPDSNADGKNAGRRGDVLAGASHHLAEEQPERFVRKILTFINST